MKIASALYCFFALLMMSATERTALEQQIEFRNRICSAHPQYGKCNGHRRLWYYNPTYKHCQTFIHSNCGGNGNRFFSREQCLKFCVLPKLN
ncbi:kunitz-type serine protease inhibitor 2-like [Drosophila hydei]|uniref:Kunitz-type serine protease inhibitor 2-like n=1 Tax=Drosophila hydei TaxID=7224 RepID=A0A6J1LBC6_DROHY|nr:kunitz-type serine protease inhibitor 2-like [Drosophila hydei]